MPSWLSISGTGRAIRKRQCCEFVCNENEKEAPHLIHKQAPYSSGFYFASKAARCAGFSNFKTLPSVSR